MTDRDRTEASRGLVTTRGPSRRGFVKRDAKRQRTQEDLRAAGLRLFAEGGYFTCSIEDIAEAAGVTRSTFYLHYDSKQALLTDIVISDMRWQQKRYEALIATGVPSKERLKEWFETFSKGFKAGSMSLAASRIAQAMDSSIHNFFSAKRYEFTLLLGREMPAFRLFDDEGRENRDRSGRLYLLLYEMEQVALLIAKNDPAFDHKIAFDDLAERFAAFLSKPSGSRLRKGKVVAD